MGKSTFKAVEKASMSLVSALRRQAKKMAPNVAANAAGFVSTAAEVVRKEDRVSLLVETSSPQKLIEELPTLAVDERAEQLSSMFVSAHVTLSTAQAILRSEYADRVQTKKEHQLHTDMAGVDSALFPAAGGPRAVTETGKDVLIGIIDSGFDLSHPMFRDASGKLRVEGLLDQTGNVPVELNNAQLETGWSNGTNPGRDDNGHGTHVGSIAAGSTHQGFEGIAPGARFLLVKTNFLDTDDAVQWAFAKAGNKPCVVNMSLGTHFGSHDGTSAEELLIDQLSGPGKVVVISAGNEREDSLHIGGRFLPNETQTLKFDVQRQINRRPVSILTLWYDPADDFSFSLISPLGAPFPVPSLGNIDSHSLPSFDLEIGRQLYAPGNAIQVQIQLGFNALNVPSSQLNNWRLRIDCNAATIGRIDGWFANGGFGKFDPHPLVEPARTVGMSATARSCIAVASHVSKNAWSSDSGPQQAGLLRGQSSPFSSLGPTRDSRKKPDISAPGQFITAALAANSEFASFGERVRTLDRLLTIEGTSMAAPVVTGIVALLLQKKKSLNPEQIRGLLAASARVDSHVGVAGWNPTFGHGKIDVKKALSLI